MIEVGRVVAHQVPITNGFTSSLSGHNMDPIYTDVEWATVAVGPTGVAISVVVDCGKKSARVVMTPEKVIELAQLMMKAAESQAEYAKAREDLEAEMTKLDAAFKDRISGLGIDGIQEPKAAVAQRVNGDVIIVDAG